MPASRFSAELSAAALLPALPMKPLSQPELPSGPEWAYQLKWDGVRILAWVGPEGRDVRLYSYLHRDKTAVYPEVVRALEHAAGDSQLALPLLLDGEVVVFDPAKGRPDFQHVIQREKTGSPGAAAGSARRPATYVLFDLLHEGAEDIRPLPYAERHARLCARFPERTAQLMTADLFPDGEALWRWVDANEWEGVVSKRLASPYREGKQHQDWYKKKRVQIHEVEIVGLVVRSGQPASLIMSRNGMYFGRASLGLTVRNKDALADYSARFPSASGPWSPLPAELRREKTAWLAKPFPCRVQGLEVTSAGLLRHPKLVRFVPPDPEGGGFHADL